MTAHTPTHESPAFEEPVRPSRLRYNATFFPEYISISIISLFISWLVLANPLQGALPLVQNPHTVPGLVSYVLVILLLQGMAVRYRMRWPAVRLMHAGPSQIVLKVGSMSIDLGEVERLEEGLGRFFGRRSRTLTVLDSRGMAIEFNDGLDRYEQLKRCVERISQTAVVIGADAMELSRARDRWQRRHSRFPSEEKFNILRIASRLFCLIPVVFFDLFLNGVMCAHLDRVRQPDLAVYVSTLSLLLSAAVARYVYYYLFTSELLHRSIG